MSQQTDDVQIVESDEDDSRVIKLRYLDLSGDWVVQDAIQDAVWQLDPTAKKDGALARLGIERQEGQSHLQAWLLAMCRENGLPEKLPCYEIGDVLTGDVQAFVWWLA